MVGGRGGAGVLALLAQPLARGERQLEVELLELLLVDRRGRAEQQLLGLLVEREGRDLAQVRLSAISITIRSMPGARPPCGGAP